MCAFQGELCFVFFYPRLPAITVSSLVVILLGQEARARVLTAPSMLGFGGDVLVLMGLWNQHFIIGRELSI